MNDNHSWSIDHNQVIEVFVGDMHLISYVILINSYRIKSIDNHQYFQRIRKQHLQSKYNIDREINLCLIELNHHRWRNELDLVQAIEDYLK